MGTIVSLDLGKFKTVACPEMESDHGLQASINMATKGSAADWPPKHRSQSVRFRAGRLR
jgi:hypothetical protein